MATGGLQESHSSSLRQQLSLKGLPQFYDILCGIKQYGIIQESPLLIQAPLLAPPHIMVTALPCHLTSSQVHSHHSAMTKYLCAINTSTAETRALFYFFKLFLFLPLPPPVRIPGFRISLLLASCFKYSCIILYHLKVHSNLFKYSGFEGILIELSVHWNPAIDQNKL